MERRQSNQATTLLALDARQGGGGVVWASGAVDGVGVIVGVAGLELSAGELSLARLKVSSSFMFVRDTCCVRVSRGWAASECHLVPPWCVPVRTSCAGKRKQEMS